jgi:hypothetical protein
MMRRISTLLSARAISATGVGLVAMAALTGSSPAEAQNRELVALLQNAVRVDCRFTGVARGEWTDTTAGFKSEAVNYAAVFFDIDVESGTAEAEGQFGASYIVVRYAEGYLHFMHTLSSGPIYLTTILAQPSTDGRLKAVHTRHEYTQVSLPGYTSRPESYLGDCSVEKAPA